jgi:hypothetical protein
MASTDRTHLFTDEDIKKILSEQSDIRTQLAEAATNLKWIVNNYNKQCADTESLKTELSNLKSLVWKYIGIGIGLGVGINLALSIAIFLVSGGKVTIV